MQAYIFLAPRVCSAFRLAGTRSRSIRQPAFVADFVERNQSSSSNVHEREFPLTHRYCADIARECDCSPLYENSKEADGHSARYRDVRVSY